MLNETIQKLIIHKDLTTVTFNDDESSDATGYFIKETDNLILMQLVTDSGLNDGYSLFEPELVQDLVWGTRALSSIDRLYQQKSKLEPVYLGADAWHEVIVEISHMHGLIAFYSMEDSNSYDVGLVLIHDEEWLLLDALGTVETMSRYKKLVRSDNICRIEFDTPYLNDLNELHNETED